MKKKLLTLLSAVMVGAVAFVGCGEKAPEVVEDPTLYWQGDFCPITNKKFSSIEVTLQETQKAISSLVAEVSSIKQMQSDLSTAIAQSEAQKAQESESEPSGK